MGSSAKVNNSVYESYGEQWYEAQDDPVALLRAENRTKLPWIKKRLLPHSRILDIGCGGGFLSNALAEDGHKVVGIDMAEDALDVARDYDKTRSVEYIKADAYKLPFPDNSFDVVTAMDFLEHVEEPEKVIQEVSRVLKGNGQFFYHTFNRHFFSWLIVIKLVEWLIPKTPKNMHVLRLFIKPKELISYCSKFALVTREQIGLRPVLGSIPIRSIFSGSVPKTMSFALTKSLFLSYMGVANKKIE